MLDESHITEVSEGARVRARAERQLKTMLQEDSSTTDVADTPRRPESSPPHPIARARELGRDKLRAIDAAMDNIGDATTRGGGDGAANEKENSEKENKASLDTSAVTATAKAHDDGAARRSRSAGRRSAKSSQEVDVEKWRAIQTWASVDSVAASMEAANGRPSAFRKFEPSSSRSSPFAVGDASELPEDTTADDVMSSRHLLSSQGDPTPAQKRHAAAGDGTRHHHIMPNLPDTLSPITQVAEPPVHDDLPNVQPAIASRDGHSASKQLARQRRLDAEEAARTIAPTPGYDDMNDTPGTHHPPAWDTPGAEGADTAVRSPTPAPPPRMARLSGLSAGEPGYIRSTAAADTALDLEVTRRRERDARTAMAKMERSIETLKAERDDAVERAMRADVAADAAHAARDAAVDDKRASVAESERLRRKVSDAASRLDEDERELAGLRDLLSRQASAAEDAAGSMSRDVAAAKAATAAVQEKLAAAEESAARYSSELNALKETHRNTVATAGDQLTHLTSQVQVLKSRLAAQDAREAMIADQENQISDLKSRLTNACAGVDGPVASALRRARALLRNAASDTGPGFAAEHDESFEKLLDDDEDANGLDLDKAAKARLDANPMLAAAAEKLAAAAESAAEKLADRLSQTREQSDDLRRRIDAATEFENGADALRDAYVKSAAEAEKLKGSLAAMITARDAAVERADEADELAAAAMEARDKAETAAAAARTHSIAATERAEAALARAEARAAKAELLASASNEARVEAEAEATHATQALDVARRREANAAAAAAHATDEIVAKEAAAASAISSAEELTELVTSLKARVSSLQATLDASTAKGERAERDADAAKDECERALRRAEQAETAAATYKIAADSANADVEVKTERIRELRAAVADAMGSRADDENTVSNLNSTLTSLGEKYAAVESTLRSTTIAHEEATARLDAVEGELERARMEAESATDTAVETAGEYFAEYAEQTSDLVHFLYEGAECYHANYAAAKERECEFRAAFAAVLAALDSAVAGAFAPETRAKESDENPTPDFASLAPKSLAPPTGKTLDHGLGAGADAVVEDEDAPGTNPEVAGSNPALDVDDVAPAAEARGVWAAKQLSARVHAVVYERTVAAESLAAARLDVERLTKTSGATDSELAKLRADVVAAETRAAEFGEAASKAKADAARLATEAKELKRVAEDASAKTNAIVAHDAAGKLAVADERASDLQARLDAAEERAMAAASEADAAVFKSDEAAAAAAAAEAAAAEADRQLARLAEESERLTESLIESETAAAEYQRLAMEAGRKNDELYSDLATLRAFVDVGVSVAEPVFQRVDALRRQNLRLRARLPMLAKRCVGARGVRLKALRERNAAVKDRKSFSDALKNGKEKYYELEVAFNETRLAMRDDLRAEKKKAADAQDIAQKASAELDAIVKKQEQLKRELKLSVDRHKSSGKDSAARLKDLEQRVAEAESKLRESQVDRAKNSRKAKDLEQQCVVLKKAAKAAEKSRAGAVAELSAKQVELSEADAKLKHAEAAAAAAAAAALASAHGAETLTMKLESQVDSSDRVRELREALTQALDAKAAAEEKLASDVAALEADVKELIFLGQSTAKKPPGEPSTPHSSGGYSPTPSENAALALSAIHPQRLDRVIDRDGSAADQSPTSHRPRLSVVVQDADTVAIEPTPPPAASTAVAETTVDFTTEMAAMEEESDALRAELETLRDAEAAAAREASAARAEAAASANRVAVLEDSLAQANASKAIAQADAAAATERATEHAKTVANALVGAVERVALERVSQPERSVAGADDELLADGTPEGTNASTTPVISRVSTPPLPPGVGDSPPRRVQFNAAPAVATPPGSRAPSPLGFNVESVNFSVASEDGANPVVDPREREAQPEEGALSAALAQSLPIIGPVNKMPSRNSSACASANSLASIAESENEEEEEDDENNFGREGSAESSVDSPHARDGGFAELETELALRRKLARDATRKAQRLSQECDALTVSLEEARTSAAKFEKRAAAAEKIAANAISHAETEEDRHIAESETLNERCEALATEARAAIEAHRASTARIDELELKLSDAEMKLAEAEAASESASASNTRPSTPSPVKGENDPDSVSSEVKLSINVDGGARELARDLLARAELSEAAVAELRAKLESANVRIATADEELRAARKTVEETAERADTSAQETETLKRRIETLDAALIEAKDEAESYRSGIAAAETKLAASTDESNANRQSLVQRVDAAEKDLAAALARCADMSERRDAAETRAVSAGAAADAAAAAAAENFTAKQTADRVAADLRQQMEDVKKGAEAEVDALGTRLEGALTELADARALAVGLNGFTLNPEGSESFPSEAATDGSADDLDKQPASPGTGSAPNELLEELVRRRVREAQLEADAAKLRVRLDAAESQARRTRAELEDSAVFKKRRFKFAKFGRRFRGRRRLGLRQRGTRVVRAAGRVQG